MTVLSVSHKCKGCLILSLTDLRQPLTLVIGYQPKNGTNSLHRGCSLVLLLLLLSPCYCASSPFFSPFGLAPNSLNVPLNGPWHCAEAAHLRTAGVPTGYGHDLTPFCPRWALVSGFTHPGGPASEWLQRERGTLFRDQRNSTAELGPSSGNNDTAKPIDISRKLDTAAATVAQ